MYSEIATYLRTSYQGKKHGGYNIYEDDKIKIYYDTYYPNVDVYVKLPNGTEQMVLNRSGHGYNQEFHSGEWENYCKDILYPKALEAKKKYEEEMKKKEQAEHENKFGNATEEVDNIFKK